MSKLSKEDKVEFNSEEAKKLLEKDAKDRCEKAAQELNDLCERLKVNIIAVTQIIGNDIRQAINFVSR